MSVQQTLLTILGNGDFEHTLDALKVIFEAKNDTSLLQHIALLSNRYNRVRSEEQRDVIDGEDARREKNRIAEGLIELISQVPLDASVPEYLLNKQKPDKRVKTSKAASTIHIPSKPPSNNVKEAIPSVASSKVTHKKLKVVIISLLVLFLVLAFWIYQQDMNTAKRTATKEPSATIVMPTEKSQLKEQLPDTIAEGSSEKKANLSNESVQKTSLNQQKESNTKQIPAKKTDSPASTSKSGKPALKFDLQFPPVEGMSRVVKDGKKGYLNMISGQVIGWYDDFENFQNGRAYVKQSGRRFWIDKSGRCVEGCQ